MHRLALIIATCGYVGYVRVAPGTFGSAVGLAVLWGVRQSASAAVEVAVVAAVIVLGVWSSTLAEHHFQRHDPGPIVIDEVAGMLITTAFLPLNVEGTLLGFLVFRILDIVKPWPARRFEALAGGLGVMADDCMAAIYGNLAMRGIIAAGPGWFT